jgi:hypothetical protein
MSAAVLNQFHPVKLLTGSMRAAALRASARSRQLMTRQQARRSRARPEHFDLTTPHAMSDRIPLGPCVMCFRVGCINGFKNCPLCLPEIETATLHTHDKRQILAL